MRTQSSDTDPEFEKVQIELLRKETNSQRLARALRMSEQFRNLSKRAICRANPGLSQQELDIKFVELHYESNLAGKLREFLESRDQ
ncbi:MAG: hypothetical protein ACLFUS_15815 [Candidatus Sumerlaeia bacterium]